MEAAKGGGGGEGKITTLGVETDNNEQKKMYLRGKYGSSKGSWCDFTGVEPGENPWILVSLRSLTSFSTGTFFRLERCKALWIPGKRVVNKCP
jgi:hypothetical protein